MKITIYTINNCNFCKQEKEYLTSNKLAFEEKNLEINREFLAEMLKLSNNFAGVPFTMVEKDNGEVVSLKGFTKEEFDVVLGFGVPIASDTVPLVVPPIVEPIDVVVPEIKPVEQPIAPPIVEIPTLVVPEITVTEPVSVPAVESFAVPPVVVNPVPEIPVIAPPIVEIPVIPPPVAEIPKVEPVVPPLTAPEVKLTEPTLVVPTVDPNEELKKVIDSLGAMTGEQKPASPNGMPSIPDFPVNK